MLQKYEIKKEMRKSKRKRRENKNSLIKSTYSTPSLNFRGYKNKKK